LRYKISTNWFQREKLKGEFSIEKLKERLNYLLRKRDKIIEFNKPQPYEYYRKTAPDTSYLDKEIEEIKKQLYNFV